MIGCPSFLKSSILALNLKQPNFFNACKGFIYYLIQGNLIFVYFDLRPYLTPFYKFFLTNSLSFTTLVRKSLRKALKDSYLILDLFLSFKVFLYLSKKSLNFLSE